MKLATGTNPTQQESVKETTSDAFSTLQMPARLPQSFSTTKLVADLTSAIHSLGVSQGGVEEKRELIHLFEKTLVTVPNREDALKVLEKLPEDVCATLKEPWTALCNRLYAEKSPTPFSTIDDRINAALTLNRAA